MNIRPIAIAIFIIVVLASLFGLTYLSQSKAVNETHDGIGIGDIGVKYPTTATFLNQVKDTSNTKEKIDAITNVVAPIEDLELDDDIVTTTINDSITKAQDSITKVIAAKEAAIARATAAIPDLSNIDTTKIERIKFPNEVLLKEIKSKLNKEDCRIIHYGDSQLEGDRISGYLRNRLQGIYGGNGPGFIPIKQVYDQISAVITPSNHWDRYAIFDPTKKRFEHKKYGLYLSTSRFTEPITDSISIDTLPEVTATITIAKSNRTYRKFRVFNTIGLHYGNCTNPVRISVTNNGTVIQEGTLIADGNYHNYKITVPTTPTNLIITLKGKISPDFYGLTLDGNNGIQLDNVAMRGASGTIFTRNDATTYQAMSNELNPEIIIMQYGGNAIPYVKDSTGVDNYVKYMKSQINWIRRRNKNASFLFIGPTDMSTTINGNMETYPLLPYANEQLIDMCMNNNIAYWSMYDAMGGKNTMPVWVEKKLAANDYTHFTPKGTKIISELFFTALYLDLKEDD